MSWADELMQIQSKLLSKSAQNPYAAYASSCDSCKTKVEAGKKYCQRCAYSKNGNHWPCVAHHYYANEVQHAQCVARVLALGTRAAPRHLSYKGRSSRQNDETTLVDASHSNFWIYQHQQRTSAMFARVSITPSNIERFN